MPQQPIVILLLGLLHTLLVGTVMAATCDDSTVAMQQCASKRYRQLNAQRQTLYQQQLQQSDNTHRQLLIQAETAWETYRQTTCDVEADQFRGGSAKPLAYVECLNQMTQDRIQYLNHTPGTSNCQSNPCFSSP